MSVNGNVCPPPTPPASKSMVPQGPAYRPSGEQQQHSLSMNDLQGQSARPWPTLVIPPDAASVNSQRKLLPSPPSAGGGPVSSPRARTRSGKQISTSLDATSPAASLSGSRRQDSREVALPSQETDNYSQHPSSRDASPTDALTPRGQFVRRPEPNDPVSGWSHSAAAPAPRSSTPNVSETGVRLQASPVPPQRPAELGPRRDTTSRGQMYREPDNREEVQLQQQGQRQESHQQQPQQEAQPQDPWAALQEHCTSLYGSTLDSDDDVDAEYGKYTAAGGGSGGGGSERLHRASTPGGGRWPVQRRRSLNGSFAAVAAGVPAAAAATLRSPGAGAASGRPPPLRRVSTGGFAPSSQLPPTAPLSTTSSTTTASRQHSNRATASGAPSPDVSRPHLHSAQPSPSPSPSAVMPPALRLQPLHRTRSAAAAAATAAAAPVSPVLSAPGGSTAAQHSSHTPPPYGYSYRPTSPSQQLSWPPHVSNNGSSTTESYAVTPLASHHATDTSFASSLAAAAAAALQGGGTAPSAVGPRPELPATLAASRVPLDQSPSFTLYLGSDGSHPPAAVGTVAGASGSALGPQGLQGALAGGAVGHVAAPRVSEAGGAPGASSSILDVAQARRQTGDTMARRLSYDGLARHASRYGSGGGGGGPDDQQHPQMASPTPPEQQQDAHVPDQQQQQPRAAEGGVNTQGSAAGAAGVIGGPGHGQPHGKAPLIVALTYERAPWSAQATHSPTGAAALGAGAAEMGAVNGWPDDQTAATAGTDAATDGSGVGSGQKHLQLLLSPPGRPLPSAAAHSGILPHNYQHPDPAVLLPSPPIAPGAAALSPAAAAATATAGDAVLPISPVATNSVVDKLRGYRSSKVLLGAPSHASPSDPMQSYPYPHVLQSPDGSIPTTAANSTSPYLTPNPSRNPRALQTLSMRTLPATATQGLPFLERLSRTSASGAVPSRTSSRRSMGGGTVSSSGAPEGYGRGYGYGNTPYTGRVSVSGGGAPADGAWQGSGVDGGVGGGGGGGSFRQRSGRRSLDGTEWDEALGYFSGQQRRSSSGGSGGAAAGGARSEGVPGLGGRKSLKELLPRGPGGVPVAWSTRVAVGGGVGGGDGVDGDEGDGDLPLPPPSRPPVWSQVVLEGDEDAEREREDEEEGEEEGFRGGRRDLNMTC